MGLPEWDPVRLALEDSEDLSGSAASMDWMDPETTSMWWAGKEFHRDQPLSERVGRNEKTKVVVKLQRRGSGPPAREPAVSEEDRKAMMAIYFKKQEEAKKLAENDDDSYHDATWADPRGLKTALHGTGGVSWRPGGRR